MADGLVRCLRNKCKAILHMFQFFVSPSMSGRVSRRYVAMRDLGCATSLVSVLVQVVLVSTLMADMLRPWVDRIARPEPDLFVWK